MKTPRGFVFASVATVLAIAIGGGGFAFAYKRAFPEPKPTVQTVLSRAVVQGISQLLSGTVAP